MVVMKEVEKALEKDFRVGDHFDVAASKLVIGIVGYCIEKNINYLLNEDLDYSLITKLIVKTPFIFDELSEDSETRQYFYSHFGSISDPVFEGVKMTVLSEIEKRIYGRNQT
ncbi:hypothetical protein [Bacillus subtilis]|uniref:hypothetical protein n=1 Tax=Bacillus subtilis TaxID=1423 RepID=UPI002795A6F2|nr:hypothetical protein [Bacillus subtilis]